MPHFFASTQLQSVQERYETHPGCWPSLIDTQPGSLTIRPPICNLKKIQMAGWTIWLIFGLAELLRKLKNSTKIRLNTKILPLKFSWLQTISAEQLNLNWNDCQREWLLSVSLMLQNLHPSVIARSFESWEWFTSNNMQVTYLGVDFTLLFKFFPQIFSR